MTTMGSPSSSDSDDFDVEEWRRSTLRQIRWLARAGLVVLTFGIVVMVRTPGGWAAIPGLIIGVCGCVTALTVVRLNERGFFDEWRDSS